MAPWFGPKEPGFELGVRAWQGWVAVAIFLALLAGARFLPAHVLGLPDWVRRFAPLGVILVFLPIFYFHYERD